MLIQVVYKAKIGRSVDQSGQLLRLHKIWDPATTTEDPRSLVVNADFTHSSISSAINSAIVLSRIPECLFGDSGSAQHFYEILSGGAPGRLSKQKNSVNFPQYSRNVSL